MLGEELQFKVCFRPSAASDGLAVNDRIGFLLPGRAYFFVIAIQVHERSARVAWKKVALDAALITHGDLNVILHGKPCARI